ncbi:thioesterase II family protein [Saccharomonospora xinjiangensis]|uniref:Putative thioesterase involved in non-ribosomal peptide biosynthesis n=1 Tax=Saccharomonospora xinjiangensis XJ-54 TaxID=882086 RepID=I0V4L0_9PSEU|nr:alpha/beta fold hydrolase [Saccharomonospora xinjiangensis]EID55063.1 putative thioesterase involved in non-ribosomal peptide biosynthesis [Saccharomonospora xinjiangensis XJ-54]
MTRDDNELWIRRFHPAPEADTRLVCLPHAGGSASFYFPVSRTLTPRFEVLAVQYPGRQDRRAERCLDTIAELADAVVARLVPWTDKPLAFFGHSMGATLAFEIALRLEQRGIVASALFASGRRAPSCGRAESVHLEDDDTLVREIGTLGGSEAQVLKDEEILRAVLPAIRADYKAAETYRYQPGPPLSCPVYAMVGDNDPKASIDEARSWERHTTGHFELRTYPGGHFYLVEQAASVTAAIVELMGAPSRT